MSIRTHRGPLLALAVVALALAAGAGWWYRTTRPAYRLQRGQAAARAGDYDRANAFADLLESAGHADEALLLRGEALLLQGEPTAALHQLNRIKGDGPPRTEGAVLAGRCLIALKNPRAAERALLFAVERNP